MSGAEIPAVVASLSKLWHRTGSVFLWALGVGALLALAACEASKLFDPGAYQSTAWIRGYLLVAAAVLISLAAFKTFVERNRRTVRMVPIESQCTWGVRRQPDGTAHTHIVCSCSVYAITDGPIHLVDVELIRPRFKGRLEHKYVGVQQQPGEATERGRCNLNLIVPADLTPSRGPFMLVAKISDQFGHWHTVRIPDLRNPDLARS